jgi:formamidopyrimidine-DNA glycosylase
MPELPEVETTVRYLQERISGAVIADVKINWPRTVVVENRHSLEVNIIGGRCTRFFRRAKFIGVELESAKGRLYMLAHQRMSGSFDVVSGAAVRSKHDHVIFCLRDGRELRFHDPRKFGRIYFVSDPEVIFKGLGPEPLETTTTPELFYQQLRAKKGAIKSVLLDQRVIAGLGNIYVDEVLWRTKIHPRKPANSLSKKRYGELLQNIKETLQEAIAAAGTDFGDGVIKDGSFTPQCYGRNGEPCLRCGTKIKKITLGSRGTHFCPRCQRS